jgi:RNA polymerase-binding transcription factor DksA
MESVRERQSTAVVPYEHIEAVLGAEADRLRRLHAVVEAELVEMDEGEGTELAATDPAGRMVLLALLEHCWSDMEDITAATARLRTGCYGLCECCGCAISPERLRAVPEGPLCGVCASGSIPPGASARR